MNALESNADPIDALQRYLALWDRDGAPPDLSSFLKEHSDSSATDRFDILLNDQRKRWTSGRPKPAEDYMREFPDLIVDDDRRVDLAYGEFLARREIGESIDIEKFLDRFATIEALLERQFLLGGWNQESGEAYERNGCVSVDSKPTPIDDHDPDAPLSLDDFDLLEPFPAGGMGIVYKAWRKSLKTHVAVKILQKTDGRGSESARRFLEEARIVARLRHPHIVGVQGIGRTPDGRYFIVMDLVDGPDLEQRSGVQKLDPKRAAELTAQVADAVAYAHSKGIVHRDLKPSNVLLDGDRAMVTDFGLAKSLFGGAPNLEDSNKIVGTLAFMAPEQVDSRWGPIDERTDVFGLGALLYKLLTGKPPIQGVTIDELIDRASSSNAVPAPRTVVDREWKIPIKLEAICLKCLSKDPSRRYASAHDVALALRASTRRGVREWIATVSIATLLLIVSIFSVNKMMNPPIPPDPIVVRSFDVLRVRGNETTNLVKSAGSIKNDDKIRLDVLLSRPGFIYVWWIDSDGKAKLIQPVGSAMRNPKRTDHLRLPEQPGNGVIVTGTSGTEVVVLTAREEPISESELDKLKGKIMRSVPIPKISSDVVLLDENRIVSKVSDDELVAFGDEKPRGLGDEAPLFEPDVMKPIQDLRRELGEGFGDVHILALPHE